MKEARDTAIKLFGKRIFVPERGQLLDVSGDNYTEDCGFKDGRFEIDRSSSMVIACLDDEKVSRTGDGEQGGEEKEAEADHKGEEPANPGKLGKPDENPETPSGDEETATTKPPNTENDETDRSNRHEKPLKKPDKVLPCPRCASTDTKFCYYNNYNPNQPRHFCKSCQRYWTAGGTTRNVPVGAGRRKNKNSASHCRHVIISDPLLAAPSGIHHPRVLSFAPQTPVCEINFLDKNVPDGFYKFEKHNCSSGSSVTTSNSKEEGDGKVLQEQIQGNSNSLAFQIPCLPGIPMPFYPAPYWNCTIPGAWTVPRLSPTNPTTKQTLGKHSRDGDLLKPKISDVERSILIPKTLRIGDPHEAAQRYIWPTLGIKNELNRRGLFKAFIPKGDGKNRVAETPLALQANPAALARSIVFQEGA